MAYLTKGTAKSTKIERWVEAALPALRAASPNLHCRPLWQAMAVLAMALPVQHIMMWLVAYNYVKGALFPKPADPATAEALLPVCHPLERYFVSVFARWETASLWNPLPG